MSHFHRLVAEQSAQLLGIIASILDRVVVTAILYRIWGVKSFEDWAVVSAAVGMLGLFEFGFNLYFNNSLTIEVERGNLDLANRVFKIANAILLMCGAIGFFVIVSLGYRAIMSGALVFKGMSGSTALAAIAVLSFGYASQIAVGGVWSLYRANRSFARFTAIYAIGDVLRSALLIVIVLSGGGLLAAAAVSTAAKLSVHVVFPLFDTRRRFPQHRYGLSLPTLRELRGIMAISTGNFGQLLPVILLMHVPVLLLDQAQAEAGLVGSFVLARTLVNFVRMLLQTSGVVFGQEAGRRLAVADTLGLRRLFIEGGRFFAVVSGITAGLLLTLGRIAFELWIGSAASFRFDYVFVAVLPVFLAPVSILAHNFLVASNQPFFAAAGRTLQLALTVGLTFALPFSDPALRLLVALSLGELIGFVPIAYVAVARLVPDTRLAFHARLLAFALVSCAAGLTIGTGVNLASSGSGTVLQAIWFSFGGLMGLAVMGMIGCNPDIRRMIFARVAWVVRPRSAENRKS